MPRDITVTLQDGSQHVYKNAPDDVTPDAVTARATKEFGQAVEHLDGGKKTDQPNMLMDAARSLPGGLVKGVAGIVGLPGTLSDLASSGLDAIANKVTGNNVRTAQSPLSGESIGQFVAKPAGGFYEPKTTAGRYAETAASFLPALAGGEASIGQKLLGRVLAPAAGSQAAGSLMSDEYAQKHPYLHAALQVGGALLGGGAVGGARAIRKTLTQPPVAPDVAANQYLAKALMEQNTTPQAIEQGAIQGRGQLGAEAMGPAGVGMLATLGRRPGATGQALTDALTTRNMAAPSRMMDDFTSAAGIDPRAAQGNFDAILEAGKKRATPLYEEAYKANQNIASPHLDKILETPAGKKALSDARVKMQNDMSLMGTPDAELMDQAIESGTKVPGSRVASGMKLRVYDYVKQSLDDQISTAYRAGNKNEGNILVDLKKSLVKALDDADVTGKAGPNSLKPEGGAYARARAAAGEYLGAQKAYEEGQNHILSTSVSADDVAKHVAKLSDTAKAAYNGGIANKILIQAQNGRLTPRLLGTQAVQEKLSAAIGPSKAADFIKAVQAEGELSRTGNRLMPGTGSITSDVLLNAGEQDMGATAMGAMHGAKALGHALSGSPAGAMTSGIAAIRHFAPDLLKSGGMSPEVRNELGAALMSSPQDLAARLKVLPAQIPKSASALGRLLMENR